MKRTYLIDSENINDIWVELLESLQEKDDIMVFYTDKSAHMGYDRIVRLMEKGRDTLRWFKCFEGQNALDFQLVTELGYQISLEPQKEYVIVSNDMGYDAVVRYWQQKGRQVIRIKGIECENQSLPVKEGDESGPKEKAEKETGLKEKSKKKIEKWKGKEEKGTEPEKKANRGKEKPEGNGKEAAEKGGRLEKELAIDPEKAPDTRESPGTEQGERSCDRKSRREFQGCSGKEAYAQVMQPFWKEKLKDIFEATGSRNPEEDLEILEDICKSVPVSEMALIHNVLVYQFGQTTGKGVYRFIKSSPACRAQLSTGYLGTKRQRERQYLELILRRSELNQQVLDAEGILKIISGIPRKNMSASHTALVKKLGQRDGSTCYASIRNHVKIIRSL